MKRIIYVVLFLLLIIMPFKVRAVNIDSLNITGNETAKSGDQVTITLKASTSGYNTNEGIWLVYTNLIYNSSHLALVGITSPGYNTVVQYTDNGALLVSQVIENSGVSGMCVNGILQCGTYTLTLKFQVTNVTATTVLSISTSEFGIGTLDMTEEREYTVDDVVEVVYPKAAYHDLLATSSPTPIEVKPPVTVPEEPKSDESTKKPVTNTTKSSNNYLKSLEVTNYKLYFNKNVTDYTINIDNSVTTLEIKPTVEHAKASYKITGNENLEDGSIIKITVTAEDGQTREYKINIKKEKITVEESNNETTKDKNEKPKENFNGATKKIIMIIGGVVGLFVVIVIICIINNVRDNRKLDKLLSDDK